MQPAIETTSDRLAREEANLAALNEELKLDMAQAALDVAGVVDPTPISDAAGAALSLYRGDLIGAGLSLVSMVPYVGDALAKTAKGARLIKKIDETKKKIEAAITAVKAAKRAKKAAAAKSAKRAAAKAKKKAETTKKPDCPAPVKSAKEIKAEQRLAGAQKIDRKILKGEQVGNTPGTADFRTIRGAHSPSIRNDPSFVITSDVRNADGTSVVKFTKKVADGPPEVRSKPKTSTLTPDSWSDGDILVAGDTVAATPALATRARDGTTLHKDVVEGVEWEVLKDSSGTVTSSYPTGGGGGGLDPAGFANQ